MSKVTSELKLLIWSDIGHPAAGNSIPAGYVKPRRRAAFTNPR